MKPLEIQIKDIIQKNDADAFSAFLDKLSNPSDWFTYRRASGRPYWLDLITNTKRFKILYPVLKEKNLTLPTHTEHGLKKESMTTLEKATESKNWTLVKELIQANYPYGPEKRTWDQYTRLICLNLDFEGAGTGKYQLLNQLPQKIDLFDFLLKSQKEMTPSIMGNLLLTHLFLNHHKKSNQFEKEIKGVESLLSHGRERRVHMYVSAATLRQMDKNKDWSLLISKVPNLMKSSKDSYYREWNFKDYDFIGQYLQLLSFKKIFGEVSQPTVKELLSSTLSLQQFLNESRFDQQLLQVTRLVRDFPEASLMFWEITKEWIPNQEKLKELVQYRSDSYQRLYQLHSALLSVVPTDKANGVLEDISWLNRHAYMGQQAFKNKFSDAYSESNNPMALEKMVWDLKKNGFLDNVMEFWVHAVNSALPKHQLEATESKWVQFLQQFQKDQVLKVIAKAFQKKEVEVLEDFKTLNSVKLSPYASSFMSVMGIPGVIHLMHLENIQKVKPLNQPPVSAPSPRF